MNYLIKIRIQVMLRFSLLVVPITSRKLVWILKSSLKMEKSPHFYKSTCLLRNQLATLCGFQENFS